jgi:HD superfamily phosphodiesterase
LTFHNVQHTIDVVEAADIICKNSTINKDQYELIMLSAWFHDTGYTKTYKGHEKASCEIAEAFLTSIDYPKDKITIIKENILSTDYNVPPKNILENILNDADLFHLSTSKFIEKSNNLKKELIKYHINGDFNDDEWMAMNLHFIKKHHYRTKYGQEVLEIGRAKNTKSLKKEYKALHPKKKEMTAIEKENEKLKAKLEKLSAKGNKPDRGIETMFRTTSKNHLDLSSIADNKANIMISINSIIISILMTVMIRKFEDYPNLIFPTILLITSSLTTIIFSVLATRPNITKGKFTRDDLMAQRTNLLFFGNFFKMDLKEYEWGINQLMLSSDLLYGSMTRDIFFLGKVLGRKYRLLRTAYNIFMFGLIISVLAYGAAMMFFPVYH